MSSNSFVSHALPVLDVDLFVNDVDVAADDHLTRLAKRGEMRHELVHEAEFRLLSVVAARTGRNVHGNDRQPVEARFHVTAFGIELFAAEADDHFVRLAARV